MHGRVKSGQMPHRVNRSFRHVLIPVWLVVIVLLTATYGNSKTVTPYDKLPHPTTAPLTSAEGAASARHPADLLLSKYLRFGRLTAENGLSNVQTRGVAQDNYGFMWFATLDGLNRYDGSGVKGQSVFAY